MYTLYGMTGSCSMAVHALLEEIGAPYTVVDVRVPAGQSRPAEFLKINPRGSVPVLVEGDMVVREGGAIMTYLMDAHNSPLLPKSGAARAQALEWLLFANATLHPAYSRVFYLNNAIQNEEGKKEAMEAYIASINKLWADVDGHLADRPYVCGDTISAADILLAVIANWGQDSFAKNITLGSNVKRMISSVTSRPSFQKALHDENITYKAAA